MVLVIHVCFSTKFIEVKILKLRTEINEKKYSNDFS